MTETASLLAAPSLAPQRPPASPEAVGRYVMHFGDVRSGELWGTLPASAFTWASELRATGDTNCTVPASPEATGLWEALKAGPALVAVAWAQNFGRRILWASPVVARDLGDTSLTVGGSGIFGLLGRRLLIPNVAADQIATAPGMTFTGDNGTIMAKVVAQVLSLDEGDLPIVLEAYRGGTRTQTYYGYEMAMVAQRITDLADNDPSTDFAFLPRFADGPDYTRIVWDMVTGTEAQPLLNNTASQPIIVDGTAPGQTTIKAAPWSETAGEMGTHAYAKGGDVDAASTIRAAIDPSLTAAGHPRMDVLMNNDAKDGGTVQAYANGLLAQHKRRSRGIRVDVDAQFWWAQGARLGDSVRVMFDHPIAGHIDITSRLLSEGGDVTSKWVSLTLADTLAED